MIDNNSSPPVKPEEATSEATASATPDVDSRFWLSVVIGAGAAIAWCLPITALLALLFRFPVPFGTIEGGLDHVIPSLFALLFYGVFMGGFIVIGFSGAVVGLLVHFYNRGMRRETLWGIICFSALVPGICLFFLAILDWIIGPW